jgi:hypothetical protein
MTKLSFIFFSSIILTFTANAQGGYNGIKKTVDELHGTTTYTSDIDPNSPLITVSKISDKTHSSFTINFMIWNQVLDTNQKGLFIKFSDGSILRLPNQLVHAGYVHGNLGYSYTTLLRINSKNINRLTSKKIIKYAVGDTEAEVPDNWAKKYITYINCINRTR